MKRKGAKDAKFIFQKISCLPFALLASWRFKKYSLRYAP